VRIDEVMKILDEASQVIEYSHRLEQKSRELEATTAELRAANERLKEVDRLKDDFLSAVSHELRTPLTSIRSFSEILHENPGLAPEQRQEFLGIVIKESARLTRLINQLLDLAKMEAGRMEWQMAELDPRAAVEEAVAATSGLFKERGVALSVELPFEAITVHADRDRLIQVVVNLLSNAVKFCEPGSGRVAVRAACRADAFEISVSDNGPGVPPDARHAIFEKFQQVAPSDRGRPAGTGLGLAISRQIVEHFGGRIWVEDGSEGGATFRFIVPRRTTLGYRSGLVA
jgi:signal transduction histidine kinase